MSKTTKDNLHLLTTDSDRSDLQAYLDEELTIPAEAGYYPNVLSNTQVIHIILGGMITRYTNCEPVGGGGGTPPNSIQLILAVDGNGKVTVTGQLASALTEDLFVSGQVVEDSGVRVSRAFNFTILAGQTTIASPKNTLLTYNDQYSYTTENVTTDPTIPIFNATL